MRCRRAARGRRVAVATAGMITYLPVGNNEGLEYTMRIFVGGAAGALGSALVPRLVESGHEVVGTTRSPARTDEIRALGGLPVVMDGLDPDSVCAAVTEARPDAIVHQLTALSGMGSDLRKF